MCEKLCFNYHQSIIIQVHSIFAHIASGVRRSLQTSNFLGIMVVLGASISALQNFDISLLYYP